MLTIVLISLFILCYLLKTCVKPSNFPPGPPWLPIIGNTLLMKSISKKCGGQYLALLELSKKYNSNVIGLKLGPDKYVVVFGRKLVQKVFTDEEFQGRPNGFFIRLRTMGAIRGITMVDGKMWQIQRTFAEKNLKQLGFNKISMESLIHEELKTMFDGFGEGKENISIMAPISSSMLNILWTVVGGNQYLKDNKKLPDLIDLLSRRSKVFDMAGGILNQAPWIRYLFPNYSGYNLILNINSELRSLMQEIIDDHKKTINSSETRDFIDAYLHQQTSVSSGGSTFTDDQLVAILLDLFIAGSLTTTGTLNWVILSIIEQPHIKHRLHSEFDKVLKPHQLPSLDDKQKLPFAEAVLLESQRLHHVAPTAGPRRTLSDTKLAGYDIPKDSVILSSLRSIHYDEERWKDPHKFIPERFLDENGNLIPDEGLCFFGLGKRRCIGEVLAKSYLFLAFVSIFHFYDISFPNNQELPFKRVEPAGILLMPPTYTVSIKRREFSPS